MPNKHKIIESFCAHGIGSDPLRASLEGYYDRMCGPVNVYDKEGKLLRTERGISYDEAEWKRRKKRGAWSIIRQSY